MYPHPKLPILGRTTHSIITHTPPPKPEQIHANSNYLLDPHTAVGVSAAATTTLPNPNPLIVCMGCAHPAKFAPTVQAALGLPSEAAAVGAIRAWARYPAAGAALDLVASLQGAEEGKGKGVDGGCVFFPWADRCVVCVCVLRGTVSICLPACD